MISTKRSLDDLTDARKRGLLCLEINPPRGTDYSQTISRLLDDCHHLDYLNVTDSALARMKCSPIAFGCILKNTLNIEVLANFACRDRNKIAIQADLIGADILGVKSIVALTGDGLALGEYASGKDVFEVNSVGLLSIIAGLNEGKDCCGNSLKGSASLVPGAVVNPNANNVKAEVKKLKKKFEAGARYALSQPVFDEAVVDRFVEALEGFSFPIMLGLMPLKSRKSVEGVTAIPGIKISDELKNAFIADASDKEIEERSIEMIAEKFYQNFVGFHIISGSSPSLSFAFSKRLSNQINALNTNTYNEAIVRSNVTEATIERA
jgi:methylenetetrahydrofolate reductase (NADPH)